MTHLALFPSVRRQRGFSIVELMVAVVIGMLALLFATRMITGGEQGRQAALGGSDAMQNGMLAMFSISKDAGQAGFGLNDPIIAGCNTQMLDTDGYTLAPASAAAGAPTPLAAAIIQDGGTQPDTISLYSGGSMTGTASVRLSLNYTGGTTFTIDREPYGFNLGDVLVAAPEQAGAPCSLRQVSIQPPVGAAVKSLLFDNGNGTRFNSGTAPPAYAGGATRIFNLGPASKLSFHTWSVDRGFLKLRATDVTGTGATGAAVADNIVSIKALYGIDVRVGDAFDPEKGTVVGKWTKTLMEDADSDGVAGSAGDYQRIVALRLAVVARSKAPERPAAGQSCTATTDDKRPVLFASEEPAGVAVVSVTPDLAVTGDPVNWHCYRYRVFETIVPIRNSAWRPTAWAK